MVGVGRLYNSASAFFTLNGAWVGTACGGAGPGGAPVRGVEAITGALQPLVAARSEGPAAAPTQVQARFTRGVGRTSWHARCCLLMAPRCCSTRAGGGGGARPVNGQC